MNSLVRNSTKDIYINYKNLYSIGEAAIPLLSKEITNHDWSKVENKNQIKTLVGVLSLINDINEVHANKIAEEIIKKGTTAAVKHSINSIISFSLKDYSFYNIADIKIYVCKDLENTQFILQKLEEWILNIPKLDLQDIERLYIIPDREEYTYSGRYAPILSYIILIWYCTNNQSFFYKWANLFEIEYTLYHEVGHHKYKHTFGQIKEQEDEADRYANILLKKSHPTLTKIAKILKLLILKK